MSDSECPELLYALQLSLAQFNKEKREREEWEAILNESQSIFERETRDRETARKLGALPMGHLFDPVNFIQLTGISVLFLGEGDFSFVRSLMETHKPTCSILATTDMSPSQLARYPKAEENITQLLEKYSNVAVLLQVDAALLTKNLPGKKFHYSFWNFPCDSGGLTGGDASIERHKTLLKNTLSEASSYLHTNGQIRITLKSALPYQRWLEDLTEVVRGPFGVLHYVGTIPFNCNNYPGYQHVTTFSKVKPKDIMWQCATHVWLKLDN
eukprot:TRINITY_DN2969_c0_g1_i2.p1 TRINITY_DN2969_c0_g1~~TRINITY_DN2969_c0_g1_i2.p1  ORF type:complete len:291 (-),score=50.46 TRINITY_DN2969_c0_g1_i2:199-1005(-)